MNQQTTTVDSWFFWEYETYVELLNERSSKKRKEEEDARKSQSDSMPSKKFDTGGIMNRMKNSIPKFK